jgi:hypothetical protein
MKILPRRASSLQFPAACAQNALIFDMGNYTAARVNPGQVRPNNLQLCSSPDRKRELMPSSPPLDLGCRSVLIDTALYHTPPAFTPMRRSRFRRPQRTLGTLPQRTSYHLPAISIANCSWSSRHSHFLRFASRSANPRACIVRLACPDTIRYPCSRRAVC